MNRPAPKHSALYLLPLSLVALALLTAARPSPVPKEIWPGIGSTARATVRDTVLRDPARSRDIPVRIRLPKGEGRVPVILFSHGLGGSLSAGTRWAQAWVDGGFAVIHLQHPGSDISLVRGKTAPQDRLAALRTGMGPRQLLDRVADVSFVLDELERRRVPPDSDLSRLDLSRIGMAGHSFGAHTTQAVAGQVFTLGGFGKRTLRDSRIKAAVAFSPSPPPAASERAARAAFADLKIPFFSITGTRDEVPVLTDTSPEDRTLPFKYMPPGDKYLLVFDGADHAAFSGASLRPRMSRSGDDTRVSKAVNAATLAFWRATLLGQDDARQWLNGDGLRQMLAAKDRFASK